MNRSKVREKIIKVVRTRGNTLCNQSRSTEEPNGLIVHLAGLRRGTWRIVSRHSINPKLKPLPLKWVFTYKFNTDGYLDRIKARIRRM